MKNFTKKRGFFTAAAALLAVAAMFVTTWCSNGIGGNNADDFTPPEGKGAIKLSFNNEIARATIMPDATGLDLTDMDVFRFTFAPDSSNSNAGTSPWDYEVAKTALENEIVLDPGDYLLTVTGYKIENVGVTDDRIPTIRNATPIPVTLERGKLAHKAVVLGYIVDGSGEGYFKYTLTLNGGITTSDIITATMTLNPITGNGTATIVNQPIKGDFGSGQKTLQLKTGIYTVKFYLEVGGDEVTFMHILHIYEEQYSIYAFSIGLDYFNAVYQFQPGELTADDTDKNPTILYSISGGASNVTYDEDAPNISPITRGQSITFTVDNASDYDSFDWYCLGSSPLTTVSGVTTVSGGTCIINTTATTPPTAYNQFSSARDYSLTVVGTAKANGLQYATVVKFSVTP